MLLMDLKKFSMGGMRLYITFKKKAELYITHYISFYSQGVHALVFD